MACTPDLASLQDGVLRRLHALTVPPALPSSAPGVSSLSDGLEERVAEAEAEVATLSSAFHDASVSAITLGQQLVEAERTISALRAQVEGLMKVVLVDAHPRVLHPPVRSPHQHAQPSPLRSACAAMAGHALVGVCATSSVRVLSALGARGGVGTGGAGRVTPPPPVPPPLVDTHDDEQSSWWHAYWRAVVAVFTGRDTRAATIPTASEEVEAGVGVPPPGLPALGLPIEPPSVPFRMPDAALLSLAALISISCAGLYLLREAYRGAAADEAAAAEDARRRATGLPSRKAAGHAGRRCGRFTAFLLMRLAFLAATLTLVLLAAVTPREEVAAAFAPLWTGRLSDGTSATPFTVVAHTAAAVLRLGMTHTPHVAILVHVLAASTALSAVNDDSAAAHVLLTDAATTVLARGPRRRVLRTACLASTLLLCGAHLSQPLGGAQGSHTEVRAGGAPTARTDLSVWAPAVLLLAYWCGEAGVAAWTSWRDLSLIRARRRRVLTVLSFSTCGSSEGGTATLGAGAPLPADAAGHVLDDLSSAQVRAEGHAACWLCVPLVAACLAASLQTPGAPLQAGVLSQHQVRTCLAAVAAATVAAEITSSGIV